MFKIVKKEIEWAGRKLTLETGKIARQSNSVLVTYGETVVLCNVTASKKSSPLDYFPLSVHYQEKSYANGKIPGGFFKREGRSSEKEVLASRLIDRPIRPLFPKGYNNEVQIICTVLSHDLENDADIIALIGASAALSISEVPFQGPIAATKIGIVGDDFVINPTIDETKESSLDLTISGTKDSILMVESEVQELAEEEMIEALEVSLKSLTPVIDMIQQFTDEAGKEKIIPEIIVSEVEQNLNKAIEAKYSSDIEAAYQIKTKAQRANEISKLAEAALELAEDESQYDLVKTLFHTLEKKIVRTRTLASKRIDHRALDEIRQIESEVSVLPRVHGSSLFTRGETQALAVVTLGTEEDEQIIDAIGQNSRDRFLLHYNFPGYSVGEVYPMRGPGRREIGHGKLAKKAVNFALPSKEDFNYTIRVVSEITESNGSSSMATVCASTLALLDAGVPLKKMVAGIAMGLVKEGDNYVVLSDIIGDEDHLGDMDFKVAGTEDGITALQMDIKIGGINFDIIKTALSQAKAARLHILGRMKTTIEAPKQELSQYAPITDRIIISESKIREVIGQGGKVIKKLCETFDAKISIDDNGTVNVSSVGADNVKAAIEHIRNLVAEPEIGKIYDAKVEKITDYGAFVNYMNGASGLVHISEFAEEKIDSVRDFVSENDAIKIKVIGKDGDKFRLSYKAVSDGEGIDPKYEANKPARSKGPRRPDNRSGGGARDNRGGNTSNRDNRGNKGKADAFNDNDTAQKKKKGFFW
ncbi:MAG: polyribonucleotide nucleotidyltransferase [Rickettsiales bacterium]|jgi:polyribonucleotide nucleotidyltransferase|nr:polyribonucleotide nucleotidyltransferase [Rickettsiales bacterium]